MVPRFSQMRSAAKLRKKEDKLKEGEVKALIAYTDVDFLVTEHKELLHNLTKDKKRMNFSLQPELPKAYPVKIIASNQVSIEQISRRINKRWEGKFLLCRTITVPIRMTSLMTVVEDPKPNSRGVCIALYNYEPPMEGWGKDPAEILPPGTILAIKNPLFRKSTDGGYIVRCDNPVDVVEVNAVTLKQRFRRVKWPSRDFNTESIPTTKNRKLKKEVDLKSIGQYHLERKNYNKAIQAFSAAIESNPDDEEALLQRAAVYLEMMVYTKCVHDLVTFSRIDEYNEKAVFLMIRSLNGLNEYASTINYIERRLEQGKVGKNARYRLQLNQALQKSKIMYEQKLTGKYDMIDFVRNPNSFLHECADYYGAVDIVPIAGKGRGVIATENIKAGELVVGLKAFAFSAPDKDTYHRVQDTKLEILNPTQLRVISHIAHRLIHEPELGEEFYKLYAGPDSEDIDDYKVLNMNKVEQIFSYNKFTGNFKEDEEGTCGIWLYASYINHSCYDANSNWNIYGNMLLVRALKNIHKGEEITIPYISAAEPYPQRLKVLRKYGIVCDCTLCAFEREEDEAVHNQREELLIKFYNFEQSEDPDLNEMGKCIKELHQLRPDNPQMNTFLVYPMLLLARNYNTSFQMTKAIEIMESAHNIAYKTVITDYALQCSILAAWSHLKQHEAEKARRSFNALVYSLIRVHGVASEKIFNIIAPGLFEAMRKLKNTLKK